jgi:ADP-ribose pyrophosphatase YjhB (NUDIX family)
MARPLDQYPHPHLTVDVVLLTMATGGLQALLLRRDEPPFAGHWVLPGGFVRLDEPLDAAAARVLRTKTDLTQVFLEQLFTFGDPNRDPRARVVSVAYYALVPSESLTTVAPGGRRMLARVKVPWRGIAGGRVALYGPDDGRLQIGFDHEAIVALAVQRLRGKIDYAPVGFELLPREFTLMQLQQVHQAVLDTRLNKDSFRRRLLASGQLQATGRREHDVGHRPAELYRFRREQRSSRTSTTTRVKAHTKRS